MAFFELVRVQHVLPVYPTLAAALDALTS
jgi:hypothetical protein